MSDGRVKIRQGAEQGHYELRVDGEVVGEVVKHLGNRVTRPIWELRIPGRPPTHNITRTRAVADAQAYFDEEPS